MVKSILVPTDFSKNAESALTYAIGLAQKIGYAIQLVHVYQAHTTKFGEETFNKDMRTHAESNAMNELEELRSKMTAIYPDVEIGMDAVEGNIISQMVTQIAGKAENELIVMGTKGAGGLKHHLLGSNTYQTIVNSPIPVLAIPESYGEFKMDRVGLMSNFKETEIDLLTTFTHIFGKDAAITLLHVREQIRAKDEQDDAEKRDLLQWKNKLEDQTGLTQLECKIDATVSRWDDADSLPDTIHDMAEEANLDALLLSYNSKSFFKRIFSKSLVKNFAHEIHRPVFFLKESLDYQK